MAATQAEGQTIMLYYELPVYKDTYQLLRLIYEVAGKFPREHKFDLGQNMKRDALLLCQSLYKANKTLNRRKLLEEFLDDFELVKTEVKLGGDLRLISLKKMAEIAGLSDKIGRQVTAWRKKCVS